MTSKKYSKMGFTLIELLVVMAILGIVLSIYASLYYSGYKSYDGTQKNIDVEQNVRYAMSFIVNQINRSTNKKDIKIDKNILNISGVEIDKKPNQVLQIGYNSTKHVIYAYKNNIEIATNIYNFIININNDLLYIEITGENDEGTGTFTLSTDIYLRK